MKATVLGICTILLPGVTLAQMSLEVARCSGLCGLAITPEEISVPKGLSEKTNLRRAGR